MKEERMKELMDIIERVCGKSEKDCRTCSYKKECKEFSDISYEIFVKNK